MQKKNGYKNTRKINVCRIKKIKYRFVIVIININYFEIKVSNIVE